MFVIQYHRIIVSILIGIVTLSIACDRSDENRGYKERQLLEWIEPESKIRFQVLERPTLVKANAYLVVERNNIVKERKIDDDICFGTISFHRYGEWLLVLNDFYVVAGYHFEKEKIVGENEWDLLPFTKRTATNADVLASRKIGRRSLPVAFPLISERN